MQKAATTGRAVQPGMPLARAYPMPARPSTPQPISSAARKLASDLAIGLILASMLGMAAQTPDEPPANLAKLVAHRETATQAERDEYTYRQTVTIQELDEHGSVRGEYREVRDVIFSPTQDGLKSLKLTAEDFRDIREIQPLVLTDAELWNYETKFRGDEPMDGQDCWVLQVRPRQILEGQRFFDGTIWVDKKDYNIVRLQGQAVPQIRSIKQENLFPHFTTVRKPLDGNHWFATVTYADDTLEFRSGPLRERLTIAYSSYKRFGATSTFIPK
jgi:hypothetical protein